MRARRRETLLQLAEVVDGAIIIALQQVHISGRKQRLLEPRARRTKLPQVVERLLHSLFIAGGTRGLTQQVEALGFERRRSALPWKSEACGHRDCCRFFLAPRQRQLQLPDGLPESTVFDQFAIIMGRIAVVLWL